MTKEKELKLTIKQEAFARAYVETGNASEAYRRAYNAENMKQESIAVRACELLAHSKVSVMVSEMRKELAERTMWEREDSVRVLAAIATEDQDAPHAARVSAIKEINAMFGYNAPAKVDHTSSDGSMSPRAGLDISKLSTAAMAEILAAKDAAER